MSNLPEKSLRFISHSDIPTLLLNFGYAYDAAPAGRRSVTVPVIYRAISVQESKVCNEPCR